MSPSTAELQSYNSSLIALVYLNTAFEYCGLMTPVYKMIQEIALYKAVIVSTFSIQCGVS